ncbi:MAG: CHAD domain-containing protein [Alphaproteobacteria bacterium]|nr:CHAD domain-containing protein [Alphaproteobacteria bacterium]
MAYSDPPPPSPPTADVAWRSEVARCRADLARHRASVLAHARPAGIHGVRVSLRRLRGAARLFADAWPDAGTDALAAEAARIARACGPARDIEVFLGETLPDAGKAGAVSAEDLAALRRVGLKLKRVRRAAARAALQGEQFTAFEAMLAAAEAAPADGAPPLREFAQAALAKADQRVRKRGRGLARLKDAGRHRLRLAVKKARYAAQTLAASFEPAAAASYAEATARLQGALGAVTDAATARAVLDDIAGAARPADSARIAQAGRAILRFVTREGRRRERKLDRAWRVFRAAPPLWR